MRKIKFISSRYDAEWSFQLNDGRIIEVLRFDLSEPNNPIFNPSPRFAILYDTPFCLETGEIYDRQNAPKDATSLNDLVRLGLGKTVYCYDSFDVDLGWVRSMTQNRVDKICRAFKKKGFNVTPEAVWHQYNEWRCGFKSGFRDEDNGYHLFTPCGGNPFSLRATTLHKYCTDWQKTYIC